MQFVFEKFRSILKKIEIGLNISKFELISDNLEDFISDNENGSNIMAKEKTNYLSHYIDNEGKVVARLDIRIFGELMALPDSFNG